VINKIDLLKKQTKEEITNLDRFCHLAGCVNIAVSAKQNLNLDLLEKELIRLVSV